MFQLEESTTRDDLKQYKFADDIGADRYAQDGGEVITLVKSLLTG